MAEQQEREVNTGPIVESETLKVDFSKEDESDDGDEVVVPAQEESSEKEPEEQEETTDEPTSESSPEEQEEVPVQPKPVEGETPREKALRFEIVRLKRERRDSERQSLLGNTKPQSKSDDVYSKLREKYSDEEIKNSEDLVDAIAKAKGFVKRDEAYQDTANQVLDGFLDANPEYKQENDTDDVHWNTFKRIIASDYNLNGKTPAQLLSIYKKVDRDVKTELGEPITKQVQDPRKVETQKQKIQSVSHSGGTKSSSKKELDIDPAVRQHFKGFDDNDF